MKKVLSAVMLLSLGAGILAGCSGSGNGGADGEASASAGASATGKSDSTDASPGTKVKLKAIMLKHPLTQSLSKMEWLTQAEERAGVDVEWQEVSADWDQKKGALLAGGDVPDLIVGPNAITDADFAQFPGLFQDLKDLVAKDAPNVQKMFDEKPETKIIATQSDGSIFGLPKYQRFWPSTATRQYINQKWLDNLGLKMPTTWDELYDVLVAFKEKDANGDGKTDDEIPMDFSGLSQKPF